MLEVASLAYKEAQSLLLMCLLVLLRLTTGSNSNTLTV